MYTGRIIDTHTHIFPQKIAEKAVKNIGMFYGIDMTGEGTVDALKVQSTQASIYKAVVNSSATKAEQVRAINNFIASSIKDNDNFIGLISLHPDLSVAEIDYEIKFALENGFKGVKLHPDFQMFNIDCEKAEKIYDAVEGVLPILFHMGDKRYSFSEPHRLVNVLKHHRNLKAIGAHFGGYSKWDSLDCYQEVDNCWFDTSSSLFALSKDRAVELIYKLGLTKMMFGSDFPMWNPIIELGRFFDLELNDFENELILFENANKFYNVD